MLAGSGRKIPNRLSGYDSFGTVVQLSSDFPARFFRKLRLTTTQDQWEDQAIPFRPLRVFAGQAPVQLSEFSSRWLQHCRQTRTRRKTILDRQRPGSQKR